MLHPSPTLWDSQISSMNTCEWYFFGFFFSFLWNQYSPLPVSSAWTHREEWWSKNITIFFFFCQTVVTDVRIFKRKEEESQKKYVALLVFEMIQQTRRARYFLHFISFKRVSVLPFYPISSSLYSPSIPYPPLRVLVTGGGRRDNIFPLLNQSAGPDPLSKVQVHRTANKMHRPTIKRLLKMMSENYELQSTENWALEDKPPSVLHAPTSIH